MCYIETGGATRHVELSDMWSLHTYGAYIQVEVTDMWAYI